MENRLNRLESVKGSLKQKLFGIDDIIDQLVNSIQTPYLAPEFATSPTVVNLWGMTSTGKSTVVEKMLNELGLAANTIFTDIKKDYRMDNIAKDLLRLKKGTKVLVFDELHKLSSFDVGKRIDKLSALENFLGNGEVILEKEMCDVISGYNELFRPDEIDQNHHNTWMDIISTLKLLYQYHNEESFEEKEKELNTAIEDTIRHGFKYSFISPYASLRRSELERRKKYSNPEQEKSDNIEAETSLSFRQRNYDMGEFPNQKADAFFLELEKLTKELYEKTMGKRDIESTIVTKIHIPGVIVFVMGNFDELFEDLIGSNATGVAAIESMYEKSRYQKVEVVKRLLHSYLKPEFVSRLGNVHIIFPSISLQGYKDIIKSYLKEHCEKFNKFIVINGNRINIDFDSSLEEIILEKCVIPAGGVRVLKNNADFVFSNHLSSLIVNIIKYKPKNIKISYSLEKNELVYDFDKANKISFPFITPLVPLQEMPNHEFSEAIYTRDVVSKAGLAVGHILTYGLPPAKIAAPKRILDKSYFIDHPALDLDFSNLDSHFKYIKFQSFAIAAELLRFGNISMQKNRIKNYITDYLFKKVYQDKPTVHKHGVVSHPNVNPFTPFVSNTVDLDKEVMKEYTTLINQSKEEIKQASDLFKLMISLILENEELNFNDLKKNKKIISYCKKNASNLKLLKDLKEFADE